MANEYADLKSLPRGGLSSSTLPSPRKISSFVHRLKEPFGDSTVTVMLMQFGKFLDHDITLTWEQGKSKVTLEFDLIHDLPLLYSLIFLHID